jgi:hypothetical protein
MVVLRKARLELLSLRTIRRRESAVNRIIALTLLLTAVIALTHPAPAHAANGHENSCTVTNVGFDLDEMHLICASGSINYAFVAGATNVSVSPGTCPTIDIDTLKAMTSIALTARVSGLVLTVWYTDSCVGGTIPIRAITSLELTGN